MEVKRQEAGGVFVRVLESGPKGRGESLRDSELDKDPPSSSYTNKPREHQGCIRETLAPVYCLPTPTWPPCIILHHPALLPLTEPLCSMFHRGCEGLEHLPDPECDPALHGWPLHRSKRVLQDPPQHHPERWHLLRVCR